MNFFQQIYSPIAEVEFTADGWYKFDSKAAHAKALKTRNAEAKKLTAEGWKVSKFVLDNQLVTVGGIGTGNPEIRLIVNCYGLNATR